MSAKLTPDEIAAFCDAVEDFSVLHKCTTWLAVTSGERLGNHGKK